MNKHSRAVLVDIRERLVRYRTVFMQLRKRVDGEWKIDKVKWYREVKKCIMDVDHYANDLSAKDKAAIKFINFDLLSKLSNAWSWYDGSDDPHPKCIQYAELPLQLLTKLEKEDF